MSTINSKNVQVGTSGTAAQNFTLYQPATPDGTVRLGVGNSGATTSDVVTVNSSGVTVTGVVAVPAGSAAAPSISPTGDTNTGMFFPAADTIAFAEGGTEVMRIDSSGNVGIGVTPASFATVKALQLNTASTVMAFTDELDVAQNVYYNAGNKYITSAAASMYVQTGGQHLWYRAASGTAGNAISFSENARIDSSGNMMWNGTNTTTQNGNAGYIYKFFGGNNNLIMPMEVGIGDRYAILEFRQTGRTNSARASQISIGQNSLNQGDVQVYSSGANADLSGGVRLNNGATSWSAISDMRLKTVTGTYTNALQDLAKIQAIKFTWKHDQSNTPQVGVSAQSVELAVPEAISTSRNISTPDDKTDYLSVRYTELIPLMIASIQEQQALITAQAAAITSLTARIAALEGAAQ